MADNPITQARDKIDETLDAARELKDTAAERVEDYKTQTISSVREKPLQTLAIAAAIGFVIGAIWKS